MKKAGIIRGFTAARTLILLSVALAAFLFSAAPSLSDELRMISYNITALYDMGRDGTQYQTNIVKGLEPDVALLQEWKLDAGSPWGENYGAWVDEAFGDDFEWYRGPSALVPNGGIISRWPIKYAGSWNDVVIPFPQRTFDWAIINIPGDIDLQVVTIHLKAGDTPSDQADRITEATNLKALVQANFDVAQYIVVAGDFNTSSYGSEPDLIAIFDSYLKVEAPDCQPRDRFSNPFTNVGRTRKYDWIIPSDLVGDTTTVLLGVSEYQYPCGNVFDSRVFPDVQTELPPILTDDSDHSSYADHMPVVKAFNILPGGGGLFLMKADKGYDYNLYFYRSLAAGDTTYWDAITRNPSPLARDLWVIPSGNDTTGMTLVAMQDADGRDMNALAVMKNQGGDHNIYLYNTIVPGDWSYWDAISRNPSPLARDLWIIPQGDNASLLTRTDLDGDKIDELAVMKNYGWKQKLFVYNTPVVGDWTYWDAFMRNWNGKILKNYRAMDEWYIPRSSNVVAMGGMRAVAVNKTWHEGIVTVESSGGNQNLYVWNVPPVLLPLEGAPEYTWQNQNKVAQLGTNPTSGALALEYPQGQDLWIVPQRNDIRTLTGVAAESLSGESADSYDVIGIVGDLGGDSNLWFWKTVVIGDVTYPNAQFRQDGYPRPFGETIPNYGQPQARDFWVLPSGNNVKYFAAIPSTAPLPTPTPTTYIVADFTWNPLEPEEDQTVQFTDTSVTSDPPIVSWAWTFEDGNPTSSTAQNPTCEFTEPGDKTVHLTIKDDASKIGANLHTVSVQPPS